MLAWLHATITCSTKYSNKGLKLEDKSLIVKAEEQIGRAAGRVRVVWYTVVLGGAVARNKKKKMDERMWFGWGRWGFLVCETIIMYAQRYYIILNK